MRFDNMKGKLKMVLIFIILFFALSTLVIIASHFAVEKNTDTKLFTVSSVPKHKVGMVLGCVRYLSNGRENLFFRYRIEKAVELYKAGKIEVILVSGDNSRKGYDEPSDMKDALLDNGVPNDKIVLDYAGFRTLDSVVRASKVFGQEEFIVISQDFHALRALYIGNAKGMKLVGVPAKNVPGMGGIKTRIRELAARVKMMLDLFVINKDPKYLGGAVEIP